MKPKITSEPSCIESSIENALVNAEVGDYVTAVYAPEKKVYFGEVVERVEDYFCVSFPLYIRVLSESSI